MHHTYYPLLFIRHKGPTATRTLLGVIEPDFHVFIRMEPLWVSPSKTEELAVSLARIQRARDIFTRDEIFLKRLHAYKRKQTIFLQKIKEKEKYPFFLTHYR
jgi:hypothetical protein